MMVELAQAALKKLEIDFAGRIYRHLGDIGMVWSLNEIRTIEDKKLLSGHVAMILGDYNLAANLYLQSGKNFLDTTGVTPFGFDAYFIISSQTVVSF